MCLVGVVVKVWMTFVESGCNVWVSLVGVVSRRQVWLVHMCQPLHLLKRDSCS